MKSRCEILIEISEMLEWMETEMAWNHLPLVEILEEGAEKSRTQLKNLMQQSAVLLSKRNGMSIRDIWQEQVEIHISGSILEKTEYSDLLQLCDVLSCKDLENQKQQLRRLKTHFQKYAEEAKENYREKSQLYRKLLTAFGVFLVLCLI